MIVMIIMIIIIVAPLVAVSHRFILLNYYDYYDYYDYYYCGSLGSCKPQIYSLSKQVNC